MGHRTEADTSENGRVASVRVDVWLDVACLFRTRSEAQRACQGGKIEVNGQRAKPHRELRGGEEIAIGRAFGQRQRVIVRGLADRHIAKADARLLYDDVTPPPTPEQIEARQMAALTRPLRLTARTPGTRDRRALRRLKEGSD